MNIMLFKRWYFATLLKYEMQKPYEQKLCVIYNLKIRLHPFRLKSDLFVKYHNALRMFLICFKCFIFIAVNNDWYVVQGTKYSFGSFESWNLYADISRWCMFQIMEASPFRNHASKLPLLILIQAKPQLNQCNISP